MLLKDKVALVTETDNTLGYEIAKGLLEEGAKVILCCKDKTTAQKLRVELEEKDPAFETSILALTFIDESDTKRALDGALEYFKHLDILVNTFSVSYDPIRNFDLKQFDFSLETYLTSTLKAMEAVTSYMTEQKDGVIINLAQPPIYNSNDHQFLPSNFNSTFEGLTKTFANDLAPYHIRVNCIVPGPVNHTFSQAEEEDLRSSIPLGVLSDMKDLMNTIIFLSGDLGSKVSGTIIRLDGLL